MRRIYGMGCSNVGLRRYSVLAKIDDLLLISGLCSFYQAVLFLFENIRGFQKRLQSLVPAFFAGFARGGRHFSHC